MKFIYELVEELARYRNILEFIKQEKSILKGKAVEILEVIEKKVLNEYEKILFKLNELIREEDGIKKYYKKEILKSYNIVEFAQTLTSLKLINAGKDEWKGICPIHKEEHPSFFVSGKLQKFHCFGCGKKGNIIQLVKEVFEVDTKEAINLLLEKFKQEHNVDTVLMVRHPLI